MNIDWQVIPHSDQRYDTPGEVLLTMRLLVVDNSQFASFALTLGRSGLFDEVGYFCEWADDTPTAQEAAVGIGFDEIVREFDLFDAFERYDALAFPALFHAGMQEWARKHHIPVWGCGAYERLETDRWFLLETMERLGMDVSPSRLVPLSKARDIIKDGDVIKISTFRGDSETVKQDGDDWQWYYSLMAMWGPMADTIKVVVQKPLPKGCEPGFDWLVVNGQPQMPFSVGYEVKDGGYIERNIEFSDLPEPMVDIYNGVLQMIGPDYTNFLSTEVLSEHLLDITCRMPQPPGDLKLFLWQGLPDIVLSALQGYPTRELSTDPRDIWGVQLIAHNNNPKNYCRFGEIPKDIADHVFFNRAFVLDGEIWTAPWKDRGVQDWVDAASICACGKTPEEAIDEAKRIKAELSLPNGVLIDAGTTESLMKALDEGELEGYNLR